MKIARLKPLQAYKKVSLMGIVTRLFSNLQPKPKVDGVRVGAALTLLSDERVVITAVENGLMVHLVSDPPNDPTVVKRMVYVDKPDNLGPVLIAMLTSIKLGV